MPQTICPKDILIAEDDQLTQWGSMRFMSATECLSPEELQMGDGEPSPYVIAKGEEPPGEAWPEVFDDLFSQSVGLERVLDCLKKVQNKLDQDKLDDGAPRAAIPTLGRGLQERLIDLYFRQVHHICPAVDEAEFFTWYRSPEEYQAVEPQLMQLLLFSMLFAASPHLEEDELQHAPYRCVKHLQKALFTFAQAQYHLLERNHFHAESLVQCALLLSYWSPYDSTREVNSFWVSEAIRHAVASGLPDLSSRSRRRIIWWCCITRNRMISIGLRRPTLLEERVGGPLPEIGDFGEEISNPRFVSKEAKIHFAQAFIMLCSLTRIMAKSVRLQYQDYNKPWPFPPGHRGIELLEQISRMEDKLRVWNVNFGRLYARVQDLGLPQTDLVVFHVISLMQQFGQSILYEPFLRTSDSGDPQAWLVKDYAFLKIKQVSTITASITASMLQHTKLRELPIILLPWIILPMALHLVQLAEVQSFEDRGDVVHRLGDLMRVLYCLKYRYEGAQFVVKMIDAIIIFVREFDAFPNERWHMSTSSRQLANKTFGHEYLISRILKIIETGLAAEFVPR